MTAKQRVIGRASYPVALPSGRHLRPGEIAEEKASVELDHLVDIGLLFKLPALPISISTSRREHVPAPVTSEETTE